MMTSTPASVRILLAALALVAHAAVSAHGYLSTPASRSLLCSTGGNSACGAIQFEPQSLEGTSGFPDGGPADGRIASAGLAQFAPLDEQTSSRWTKRNVVPGPTSFTWTLTANHVTRNFRYYLTKPGWNPNLPLSRASFEAQPFCTIDGGLKQPPKVSTHDCTLPQRSGYHVMLGVWEIGDTVNSFYSVADLMFKDGSPQPPVSWVARGTIYPSLDLQAGDKVMTRVFDASGERRDLQTRVDVASPADGQRNTWPFLLASRINAEQPLLRAGQLGSDGKIAPVYGQNEVFARSDSGLQRVEVQIDKAAPPPSADLLVSGLSGSYAIVGGKLTLEFGVTAVGEMEVSAYVYDAGGQAKGFASTSLNNTGTQLRIVLDKPVAGRHQLVLKGVVKGSGGLIQKTFDLVLTGGGSGTAQYVFPDGLSKYQAGTLVLQPKTGRVYECKPFPYSGFCVQWSSSATQFEPGVGSNWRDAWLER